MTALWVGLAVAAAFLQNFRSSLQKHLRGQLSTEGASATRFLYGLPFALLGLTLLSLWLDTPPPPPNARFAVFTSIGSLAQIGGTISLLAAFSSGSFAAGTTYSKTEGLQTVVFGYLFLGDRVSAGGLTGVALTVLGVLVVSSSRTATAPSATRPGTTEPRSGPPDDVMSPAVSAPAGASPAVSPLAESSPAVSPLAMSSPAVSTPVAVAADRRLAIGLGLASGALFALSAVCYRGASLALGDDHFALRAGLTLVVALGLQSLVTAVRLRLAEPGELTRIARAWRPGTATGLAGAGASAGWFAAFTLVDAAYVKAVGSVELVFAVASSWLIFRERPSGTELAGIALVMAGIAVTVLLR